MGPKLRDIIVALFVVLVASACVQMPQCSSPQHTEQPCDALHCPDEFQGDPGVDKNWGRVLRDMKEARW